MARALASAREAAAGGEVPVGAVALHEGRLVAVAGNRRESEHDPTAHAEILVLRQAARALGRWRLDDVTIVVTLEPCAMCAGALINARIAKVVIGAMDERYGAAGSRYNLLADPRLNHSPELVIGLEAEESSRLLRSFFAQRR